MIETPAKHTIFKALLYTFGTSVLATILYRVLLRRGGSGGGSSRFTFLSVFLKPLQFIFKDLEHNETKIIPFEDKYFNEYDDWQKRQQQQQQEQQDTTSATEAEQQHRKECLENMYYSTVRETIDDFYGDVIMCYDHATLSFAYYARTANIPYKYLETISRKYMIETNAPREIHVDIRDEYNKAKNRTATTTASSSTSTTASSAASSSTTASNTATEETPDVFVKLKSYNTASNLNLHTTTNETTNKIHKYVAGTEGPPTGPEGQPTGTAGTAGTAGPTGTAGTTGPAAGTTNKIFREKANRYSYRGKIADFDVNHKTFLADRRAAATTADTATTTTADTDTTAASTADTAAATGYAEFKKQWMT